MGRNHVAAAASLIVMLQSMASNSEEPPPAQLPFKGPQSNEKRLCGPLSVLRHLYIHA